MSQNWDFQLRVAKFSSRDNARAHRLRADDEGRPIRRQADCGLNARGHSIRSFRHQGDQHRGRLRSDVNQRKRLGSPNTGQRQYERERTMGRRATRTNHQGQRMPSLPRQQAVYMTAPETFTTASKQPLTKERRPDMTGIHAQAVTRQRVHVGAIVERARHRADVIVEAPREFANSNQRDAASWGGCHRLPTGTS
jgi:hypothetical protein